MPFRTLSVVFAFVVVLGVGAPGVHAATSDTTTATIAKSAAPSYLSTLEAKHGKFIKHSSTSYELRLTGVDKDGVFFTDRPLHQAGDDTTTSILAHFFKRGTGAPNAVVRVEDADEGQDTLIVELSSPKYEKGRDTLTLHATPLLTASPGLSRFEKNADSSLPKSFGDVTLFVDLDSQYCQVNISAADQTVVFQNIQVGRDFGDTPYLNTTPPTTFISVNQYGTWDYGCGATITADVWTNTTPNSPNPDAGHAAGFVHVLVLEPGDRPQQRQHADPRRHGADPRSRPRRQPAHLAVHDQRSLIVPPSRRRRGAGRQLSSEMLVAARGSAAARARGCAEALPPGQGREQDLEAHNLYGAGRPADAGDYGDWSSRDPIQTSAGQPMIVTAWRSGDFPRKCNATSGVASSPRRWVSHRVDDLEANRVPLEVERGGQYAVLGAAAILLLVVATHRGDHAPQRRSGRGAHRSRGWSAHTVTPGDDPYPRHHLARPETQHVRGLASARAS